MAELIRRIDWAVVMEVAGLAGVTAGVALIWWPMAPVIGGVGLIVMAQGVTR